MDYIKRILPSSRLNDRQSAEDIHEARMQKYEQHIQKNPYGPYNDSDPRYYGSLFYNMKNRIYLAVGLTFLLGITLPAIVIFVMDTDDAVNNYGDCLVPEQYRFQCDFNQVSNFYQNLQDCTNAKSCWNASESTDFRCYHSYPSGDQYFLNVPASRTPATKRQNDQKNQLKLAEGTIGIDDIYNLQLRPVQNYNDERPNYHLMEQKFQLYWHNENIFCMDFYPPTIPPPKVIRQMTNGTLDDIQVKIPTEADSLFYIQILRGKEVIFDTALGPMRFTGGNVTFSTLLPTRDFYGIKGGQGTVERMVTVDGVTTFGQNELPFYMVREESGNMNAILVETSKPFVAQIIGRPAISFHFEGDFKDAVTSVKFFKGPTAQAILEQLSSYLKLKNEISKPPMPPYWALGVHLCRKSNTTKAILDDIAKLNRENYTDPLPAIPYDSDCIAEELRNPFEVNSEQFEDIEPVIEKLEATSRRLLLTQRLSILNSTVSEMLQKSPNMTEMFILSRNNYSLPATAAINNETVNYLSIFNPESQDWIRREFQTPSEIGGLVLIDNFPRNDNASYERIWNLPANKNSRIYANFSSQPWGVVAPDAAHRMSADETVLHADLHNAYGHESLKTFKDILANKSERSLVVSSSVSAESFLHGAYTGPQVSFSWTGLRDSLEFFLRYFMFLPFSGIPVCGSWIEDVKGNVTLDQELCLRWYQAALLLPFVRNTYGDSNGNSRGPLDLNGLYQRHLVQNMKDRYAINPYYYTLFYQYGLTNIPPVAPISYYFPIDLKTNETTFQIADQLMIGPALMAAPLVYPGTSRTVYFPNGTWYTMDGDVAYSDPETSKLVTVSALIHHVPMFIRQGHIVPTLLNPIGQTAEETRMKTNYTILATYPSEELPSKGQLYFDDGITVEPEDFELITFTLDRTKFTLKVEEDAGDVALSRVISEIRIFGAPGRPKSVQSSVSSGYLPTKNVIWNGGVLTLTDLDIDWKLQRDVTLEFEY